MQPLLENLNKVPGVVGSLVCAQDGQVLAHAFPPVFDESSLREAASVLADGATGLETVTGPIEVVDLRYAQARVVVKPMAAGHLLLLCTGSVNFQTLLISISVTVKKLERLAEAPPALEASPPVAPAAEAAPPAEADAAPEAEPPPADPPSKPDRSRSKKNWWPSV